jgi:hypothetical protein
MSNYSGPGELTVNIPELFQAVTNWSGGFFKYLKEQFQGHPYSEIILATLDKVLDEEETTEMVWGVDSIELTLWRAQIRFISEKGGQKSSRVMTFGTPVVCLLLSHNGRYVLVRQSRLLQGRLLELPRCMTKHGEGFNKALERLASNEIGLPWEKITNVKHICTLGSGIAPYVRPHAFFTAELSGDHVPNPKEGYQIAFRNRSEIMDALVDYDTSDPLLFTALYIAQGS